MADSKAPRSDAGPRRRWLAIGGMAATGSAVLLSAMAHVIAFPLAFAPQAIAQDVVGAASGGLSSFFIQRLGHLAQPLLVTGLAAGFALSGALIAQAMPRRLATRPLAWALVPAPLWVLSLAVYSVPPPFLSRPAFAAATLPVFAAGGVLGGLVFRRLTVPHATAVREQGPAAIPVGVQSPLDPSLSRRWFLVAIGIGGAGVALGASGLANRLGGGSDTGSKVLRARRASPPAPRPSVTADDAFDRIPGLTREVTATKDFYVVDKDILNPVLDTDSWRLRVHGLVEHPVSLSFDDLRSMAVVERYQTLECISNKVGGHLMSTGLFAGVPLADVLERAGVRPSVTTVVFRAAGGYSESHPIDRALDPATLVVIGLNRHELPRAHGYPARLLTVGTYGMKNPKWLTDVELTDHGYRGYWEVRGWSPSVDPKITSRIDVPQGSVAAGTRTTVAGVAFAGDRGISRVQLSTDGGTTWTDATLKSPLSPYTWRLWRLDWDPPGPGTYRLVVRAFDGSGRPQLEGRVDPYPSGAAGLDSLSIRVA